MQPDASATTWRAVPHGAAVFAAPMLDPTSALMASPVSAREPARLARLRAMNILDSAPDGALEAIASAAASAANTPISLITVIDEHRQWFKAHCGTALQETPRSIAFCNHAIADGWPLVVPDLRLDPRFAENPLVTHDPHLRFYAGFPLDVGQGLCLGTLCVLDNRPRELTAAQMQQLQELTAAAVQWLLALYPTDHRR